MKNKDILLSSIKGLKKRLIELRKKQLKKQLNKIKKK